MHHGEIAADATKGDGSSVKYRKYFMHCQVIDILVIDFIGFCRLGIDENDQRTAVRIQLEFGADPI